MKENNGYILNRYLNRPRFRYLVLTYNSYIMQFRLDKTILPHPVLKKYFAFGIQYIPPSWETPISGNGLTIHHAFISAN